MTKHAPEVARGHKRRRRRMLALALVALAILLALLYLRCGPGLGGKGKGPAPRATGSAPPAVVDAGPRRCQVRLSSEGLSVDGSPAARADVVARCTRATVAEVVVTGDARQGDWDELRRELEGAGVEILLRQR